MANNTSEVGRRLAEARRAKAERAKRAQSEQPLVNLLAETRRARGWSQVELAQACDVSRETISFIERGLREPGVRLALQLALALDKPVEAIFRLPE